MQDGKPVVAIVVAADDRPPPGIEALDELARVRIVPDAAGLEAAARERVEVLGVWDFRTDLIQDLEQVPSSLRWIHAASAGIDAVDTPQVRVAGITVTNSRGVFDRGIAEFVLLAALAFAKDLPGTLRDQRERRWRHRDSELVDGRSALIVGAGSIGRTVARLLRTAGMRVDGVARTSRDDDPDFDVVGDAHHLHPMLARADLVVITAPLTAETAGMFDDGAFAAMKPGARLVNVGRGEIVDESALLRALESGHLSGAALDVFATEPLPPDNPLWKHPAVIVSPHQSGDFIGWRETLTDLFVSNLRRYLRGEPLQNVVIAGQERVPS